MFYVQDFFLSFRGDCDPPVRLRQGLGLVQPLLQVRSRLSYCGATKKFSLDASKEARRVFFAVAPTRGPFRLENVFFFLFSELTRPSVRMVERFPFFTIACVVFRLRSLPYNSASPSVCEKAGCATGSAGLMEGCDVDATDAADLCLRNANVSNLSAVGAFVA